MLLSALKLHHFFYLSLIFFFILSVKVPEFILVLKIFCCSNQTSFNFWINLTPLASAAAGFIFSP